MEDGNAEFIDGLINFKKREMIFGVISRLQDFQVSSYPYETEKSVITFVSNLNFKEESELWSLSLEREPRDAIKSELP